MANGWADRLRRGICQRRNCKRRRTRGRDAARPDPVIGSGGFELSPSPRKSVATTVTLCASDGAILCQLTKISGVPCSSKGGPISAPEVIIRRLRNPLMSSCGKSAGIEGTDRISVTSNSHDPDAIGEPVPVAARRRQGKRVFPWGRRAGRPMLLARILHGVAAANRGDVRANAPLLRMPRSNGCEAVEAVLRTRHSRSCDPRATL